MKQTAELSANAPLNINEIVQYAQKSHGILLGGEPWLKGRV
jgi:hypothetical protein